MDASTNEINNANTNADKLRFNLRNLLEQRGISIRELARRTDTRPSTLSEFANGTIKRIPVDLIEKVCRELECGVSDLIDFPVRR